MCGSPSISLHALRLCLVEWGPLSVGVLLLGFNNIAALFVCVWCWCAWLWGVCNPRSFFFMALKAEFRFLEFLWKRM